MINYQSANTVGRASLEMPERWALQSFYFLQIQIDFRSGFRLRLDACFRGLSWKQRQYYSWLSYVVNLASCCCLLCSLLMVYAPLSPIVWLIINPAFSTLYPLFAHWLWKPDGDQMIPSVLKSSDAPDHTRSRMAPRCLEEYRPLGSFKAPPHPRLQETH